MIRQTEEAFSYASPQALATEILKRAQNFQRVGKGSRGEKLQKVGGGLQAGFGVDLADLGISLAKHRKVFFAAAHLLFKKKWLLFIYSSTKILALNCTAVKKWNLKASESLNKLSSMPVAVMFKRYGIQKGGKQAYFQFIQKLSKTNLKTSYEFLPAALITKSGSVPYFKTVGVWDSFPTELPISRSYTEQEIKIPKVASTSLKAVIPENVYSGKLSKVVPVSPKLYSKLNNQVLPKVISTFYKGEVSVEAAKKRLKDALNDWDNSSTEDTSYFLQKRVSEIFGVPLTKYLKDFSNEYEDTDSVYLNGIVKATYDATQTILRKKKVNSLLLYRGVEDDSIKGMGKQLYKKISLGLNPLSSFTTEVSTAVQFGQLLIVATVPAARVFSYTGIGFGCDEEEEVVVIGGKAESIVFNCERVTDWIYDREEEFETLKGRIQDAETPAQKAKLKAQLDEMKRKFGPIYDAIKSNDNSIEAFIKNFQLIQKLKATASEDKKEEPVDFEEGEKDSNWLRTVRDKKKNAKDEPKKDGKE
jgi:hypothetical protein